MILSTSFLLYPPMTPSEQRNDLLAAKVVKSLKNRHFDAYYCKTSDEAAQLVLSLIPEGESVSWGGSQTVQHLGLPEKLHAGNYEVFDRDLAKDDEEKQRIYRAVFSCNTYLTSMNAISEDGQLVNVDGNGNRVAAITFGPKQVIVVAGINKIVKSLEDAVVRARTIASPINVQRFSLNTPCKMTGACENCTSSDCICTYVVTTRISRPAGRIKVVLIGETLGY